MRRTLKIGSLFAAILLIAAAVFTYVNRVAIYDWARLRNYTPSSQISEIATNTAMTDDARRLFYVFHPSLQDKETFNQNCTNYEKSIVLGCYVEGVGIYIYDVTDERLAGVEEVTSAHEMLHAAYDRLSKSERAEVDAMTAEAFKTIDNQRIRDAVQSYEERDASVVPNELHSILGTEVRNLPPQLEAYYTKYFTERIKVVSFSEKYERVFTERQAKVAEYDKQLESLKSQIDGLQASLESQQSDLDRRRSQMEALLNAGDTTQYNALVAGFNAGVRQYNATITRTQAAIDSYNVIVKERNLLVIEEQELTKAIDSRLTPIETQ